MCNKNYHQKFHEKLKGRFLNILTKIPTNLFYYSEKVFILMNMSMIGKNSMKQHY